MMLLYIIIKKKIDKIIQSANSNNTKFIQLYTHPQFNNQQFTQSKLINEECRLYNMIPQWGNSCLFNSYRSNHTNIK